MAPDDGELTRVGADLAYHPGWLEGGTVTLPTIESLIAGQDMDCDSREALLVRRRQTGWTSLVTNAPQPTLTVSVLPGTSLTERSGDSSEPVL